MFEKEVIVASVRRQRDVLQELLQELEIKHDLKGYDKSYAGEVLKKVEGTLRKIRRETGVS